MKVSVIIPTYNSEKTIERAIKSVLSQDGIHYLFEVEILICDDCSTDTTVWICNTYKEVKLFQNSHNSGGPNWGRNMGIKYATGDILAFLDHDDEWLPGKLVHQLKLIYQYDQDLAYSGSVGKNTIFTIQPDSSIYQDLMTWSNRRAGAYMGSIILKNEDVPLFDDPQLEYKWLIDTVKTRRCIRTTPMIIRYTHDHNLSKQEQYRLAAHNQLVNILGLKAIKNETSSLARFYYKAGKYTDARDFFRMSTITFKNVAYYFTSFFPPLARFIVKKYHVWG